MKAQTWIETLVAMNADIVACERRFHDQCMHVARLAEHDEVSAKDEMLLASYMTSLALMRVQRNDLLAEARPYADRPGS